MAKGSGSPNGGVNQGKSSSDSTSSSKSASAASTGSKGSTSQSTNSKSAPSSSSKSSSSATSSKTASKTEAGISGLLSGLLGAFGIKTDSAPTKTGLSAGPAQKTTANAGKLTGNAAVVAREMAAAGFGKAAIASAIGRLSIESYGRLDPKARNKGDAKDGTDSVGIAQWNRERLAGLKDFSAKQGLKHDTIEAQAKYFVHELTTTEKAAGDRLRAAQDTKAGAKAMLDFERPKSRDPSQTIAAADKVLGLLGDGAAKASNPPQAGPYGYMFGMADPAPNTGKATVTSIDKAQPKQAGVFETALKFATDPVGTAFDMIGKMDFANAKGTSEPGMAANPGGSNEKPAMFQGVDNAIQVATPIIPTAVNTNNPLLLPSGRKPFDWSKIKVL